MFSRFQAPLSPAHRETLGPISLEGPTRTYSLGPCRRSRLRYLRANDEYAPPAGAGDRGERAGRAEARRCLQCDAESRGGHVVAVPDGLSRPYCFAPQPFQVMGVLYVHLSCSVQRGTVCSRLCALHTRGSRGPNPCSLGVGIAEMTHVCNVSRSHGRYFHTVSRVSRSRLISYASKTPIWAIHVAPSRS